ILGTICLFIALAVITSPHTLVTRPLAARQQQDECEKAHPWQHKVNGECVDKPHVAHYHGDHNPEPGEQCWIECLCRRGESPGAGSCGSCSYSGTVCIRD